VGLLTRRKGRWRRVEGPKKFEPNLEGSYHQESSDFRARSASVRQDLRHSL